MERLQKSGLKAHFYQCFLISQGMKNTQVTNGRGKSKGREITMAPKTFKIWTGNKTVTQTDPTGDTCLKLQAEGGKRNLESSSAVRL